MIRIYFGRYKPVELKSAREVYCRGRDDFVREVYCRGHCDSCPGKQLCKIAEFAENNGSWYFKS